MIEIVIKVRIKLHFTSIHDSFSTFELYKGDYAAVQGIFGTEHKLARCDESLARLD
jgi:hypothetical protein